MTDDRDMIVIEDICLGDSADAAAVRWGDNIGWVFGDERVTFRQMQDRANLVARSLLSIGIRKGDVVALWMSNLPEFAYCLMGCGKIGAIAAAINTRSRSFEVEHVLRHSEAKVLVRMDRFLKMDFRTILKEVAGPTTIQDNGSVQSTALPELQRVISLSDSPVRSGWPWRTFLDQAAMTAPEALALAQSRLHCEEPVILQYTSGTTARPKGALCNHRYICNFGIETVRRLGVATGEAVLNTQPFYHIGGAGAVCVPLRTGHRSVIPEYYDAERVLGLIQREGCVARSGFGAMYVTELAHPNYAEYELSSLRAAWCIAPPELMRRVRTEMKIPAVVQIYGATEGGGAAGAFNDPHEKQLLSCGRAMTGTEIAIVDSHRNLRLPPGGVGEILVRGWYRMNAYKAQPDATMSAIDAEGWCHTGDLGALDEDGYLYFKGRLKDMLKVGGENVAAEEVEALLMLHPKVKMAAVIGAPDPRLQEVVLAVIQLHDETKCTEQEIVAFCAKRMANFRVPRIVRFTDEWPMTGSGKVQKYVLRQRFLGS